MTDLAVPETHANLTMMVRELAIEVSVAENESGSDFALQIMEGVLSADSFEDVFANQEVGTTAGQNFIDRPFFLKGSDITWRRTTPEYLAKGAFPFWALLNVVEIETGEDVTVDCGGQTFVAALFRLQKLGYFDQPEFKENGAALKIAGRPTTSGTTVLFLRPVNLTPRGRKG